MSSSAEDPGHAALSPPRQPGLVALFRFWFGISDRVRPAPYAASGLSLGLFKYGVEALVIWAYSSSIFWPWDFLNPSFAIRSQMLHSAPEWVPWMMFLWTLPFMWIAVTMSVRRVADVGDSPWLGLLVVIPIVNYCFMLWACLAPTRPTRRGAWFLARPTRQDRASSAALAVGCSLIVGGLMIWSSVYLFKSYGTTLFLGAPMLMGATAGYIFNRGHPRGYVASAGIGLAAVFFGGCALCSSRSRARSAWRWRCRCCCRSARWGP